MLMMNTPVLFIIFNRPDTTQRVFEAIRQAQPRQLFVAADGPREGKESEAERCQQARVLAEQVDWDCQVRTLYREKNSGCKMAVSAALHWFFENVEEGIILEDDCLPHPTFFRFCAELLEKYRDDKRIMMISGSNFQFGQKRGLYSYYFSRYSHIWGWASWRRAWQHYDVEMKLWPMVRDTTLLQSLLADKGAVGHWSRVFDKVFAGDVDTWDYQWTFACWTQNALTVVPNDNLVSNIGFGTDATHTIMTAGDVADLPAVGMSFPLHHPPYVLGNLQADQFMFETIFAPKRPPKRPKPSPSFKQRVLHIMPDPIRKLLLKLHYLLRQAIRCISAAKA
jgi:hypothetical protein